MMNTEKLKQVIEAYKADFSEHFEGERYKWEAVKCFQDNWNIYADDLVAMLKQSFSKTGNLLAASYYYPLRMIWEFAKTVPETVKEMFSSLFNEKRELTERINKFLDSAEYIRKEYDPGTWKNHYQNINTISVYLTLKYPRKYSFYKNNIYKAALELTDFVQPKGFSKIDKLLKYYEICDEIYEIIRSDTELIDILNVELSLDEYNDYSLHLLVQDIVYFNVQSDNKTEITDKTKSNDVHYWIYSPGNNASMWEEFYNEGVMGLGWDELDDFRKFSSREKIASELQAYYADDKTYKNDSLAVWQFVNEMNQGDIVFAKKGLYTIVGCGIVVSDYIYDSSRGTFKHNRKMNWTHKGEWKHPGQAVMKTLTDITQYKDYVQKLIDIIESNGDSSEKEPYTKEDFLNEVFITSNQYDTLTALLEHKKNVILQGAPGVGKTFTAKRLAYSIMGEKDNSRIEFIQFHQSYSYEDFIMGYRPTDDGSFELKRGVFYRFCDKARNDPDRKYFFIIDEINRGNLSKIFGEMLMLIEADKRGDKLKLTYQKEDDEPFSVPDNLYIIGMMNTADRSLAMIDYALRRRFSFFEMSPGFDSEGFKGYSDSLNNDYFNALIAQIKLLNKEIEKDGSLGKGFCIGHSYFCNLTSNICTDERLREIVEYDIIPMLSEYWFDDRDKADKWSANLRGLFNDD